MDFVRLGEPNRRVAIPQRIPQPPGRLSHSAGRDLEEALAEVRRQEYVVEPQVRQERNDLQGFRQVRRPIVQPGENMGMQVDHVRPSLRLTDFRTSSAIAGMVAASSLRSRTGDMFLQ